MKWCAAVCAAATMAPLVAGATAYDARPKIVVILVLDQFRGDYLDRWAADFKTPNGFNLFLKQGAYFPNCYYQYANTMTAPGHSTIGTGAYSDGHNIAVNDWWDTARSRSKTFSSVDDEHYKLVGGADAGQMGASPWNEMASTLGDEVVLGTSGKARLYGVSLKDRAAILTSGHAGQGAFWIDHATGQWQTSTYWMDALPPWVQALNASTAAAEARKASGKEKGEFYEAVGSTIEGVRYELSFAKDLISHERLGQGPATDVLTISLSSTDILGHAVGPDSPEQRRMVDGIDAELNGFFGWLGKQEGGMNNVWVAMTGDHGVAPNPTAAQAMGMPAAYFPNPGAELNKALNARLSPGAAKRYVLGGELPYIQLDSAAFGAMSEEAAEALAAELAPAALLSAEAAHPHEGREAHPTQLRRVYTKTQMARGDVPATEEGRLVLHSYSSNGGWWIMVAPSAYAISGHEGGSGTSHFTPYSYDRHVPLAFYGTAFKPGTYLEDAEPVDIAATFAALLRVNRPSACVGHVRVEALKGDVVEKRAR